MSSSCQARLALVVEDDDSVREMMCYLLESAGFQVLGCRDGREGLRAVRELHPSVVTLDLQMPGMDGVEVLDNLHRDKTTADVPVVVVSACDSEGNLRSRRQVKAVFSKPFDVDELCDRVCAVAIA